MLSAAAAYEQVFKPTSNPACYVQHYFISAAGDYYSYTKGGTFYSTWDGT